MQSRLHRMRALGLSQPIWFFRWQATSSLAYVTMLFSTAFWQCPAGTFRTFLARSGRSKYFSIARRTSMPCSFKEQAPSSRGDATSAVASGGSVPSLNVVMSLANSEAPVATASGLTTPSVVIMEQGMMGMMTMTGTIRTTSLSFPGVVRLLTNSCLTLKNQMVKERSPLLHSFAEKLLPVRHKSVRNCVFLLSSIPEHLPIE
jgi:hypothetical protein